MTGSCLSNCPEGNGDASQGFLLQEIGQHCGTRET
jgi:hypothetical protein